jgi:hypothetical protein
MPQSFTALIVSRRLFLLAPERGDELPPDLRVSGDRRKRLAAARRTMLVARLAMSSTRIFAAATDAPAKAHHAPAFDGRS